MPTSRTGKSVVTGGRKSKILKKIIDQNLGVTDTEVWYERPGNHFEMMGQEGGWFYSSDDAQMSDTIGLNFEEAKEFATRFIDRDEL